MIEKLLIATLGGLAGHQSRRFTRHMESGWRNLIEHAIGGSLLLPFLLMLLDDGEAPTPRKITLSYIAALFAVGVGVALGWIIDSLSWAKED